MKKVWRFGIDGLVVLMALVIFGPYLAWQVSYDNAALPDETKSLDDEIHALLDEMPGDFQNLLEETQAAARIEVTKLDDRKPLTPAFNYLQNVESVVYINSSDVYGYYFGTGSILTEDGIIISNYHNVDGAENVVVTTHDGVHYPVVEVLAFDAVKDVVIFKIDAAGLRPMPVGDDTEIAVGEQTLVIGHPEGFLNTISLGVLSGRRSYHSTGEGVQLQITNPISGGNSGGAILNEYGELVGIPTATIEYEDNSVQVQNINLAVPISEALKIVE